MKECRRVHKNFVAYLCGELSEEERLLLQTHLQSCPDCQEEVSGLKEIQESADTFRQDIAKVMSSVDWETLSSRITDEVLSREVKKPQESWLLRFSRSLIQPRFRPVYAGLLVGILLGSLVTLMVFRAPVRLRKQAKISMPREYFERVELEMARRETLDYLEKSKYLILDVLQASSEHEPSLWQRPFASQRAKDLLQKKKFINHQLDTFQMVKAKEICGQIEFLLYELAQISDQAPAEELVEVLNLIEGRQLLFKIKLLKKELEKRDKSEV